MSAIWNESPAQPRTGGELSTKKYETITSAWKAIVASRALKEKMSSLQRFRLLDLPLELRELIYHHVFNRGGPIRLYTAKGGSMYKMGGPGGLDLRLLFTCRQVYNEATTVMYKYIELDFFGDAIPHIYRNRELQIFKKAEADKAQTKNQQNDFATIRAPLTDIRSIKICAHWVQHYSADTSLEFIKWFPNLRNLNCVIAARGLTDENWDNVVRLVTLVPQHINLDIERSDGFQGTAYPAKEVWLALKQRSPFSKFVQDLNRWEDPTVAASESRKKWPLPFHRDPASLDSKSPKWAK